VPVATKVIKPSVCAEGFIIDKIPNLDNSIPRSLNNVVANIKMGALFWQQLPKMG
jgi:hypothetical protein